VQNVRITASVDINHDLKNNNFSDAAQKCANLLQDYPEDEELFLYAFLASKKVKDLEQFEKRTDKYTKLLQTWNISKTSSIKNFLVDANDPSYCRAKQIASRSGHFNASADIADQAVELVRAEETRRKEEERIRENKAEINAKIIALENEKKELGLLSIKRKGEIDASVAKLRAEYEDVSLIARNQQVTQMTKNTATIYSGEWVIIDADSSKVLVIAKDCVAQMEYYKVNKVITWEHCTLRRWLNGEFYNSFTQEQKRMIAETSVVNTEHVIKDNVSFLWEDGNDTTDRIFLLSINEVGRYSSSIQEGIATYKGNSDRWWLRSRGRGNNYAACACLDSHVSVSTDGFQVNNSTLGVRPALWLNLQS
jgi:hypothetical protein